MTDVGAPFVAPRASLYRARTLAATALAEARDVAVRLRPTRVHEIGLGAALRNLAGSAGIAVELRFEPDLLPPGLLEPEVEIDVFRIVQEAVGNAARHSRADASGSRHGRRRNLRSWSATTASGSRRQPRTWSRPRRDARARGIHGGTVDVRSRSGSGRGSRSSSHSRRPSGNRRWLLDRPERGPLMDPSLEIATTDARACLRRWSRPPGATRSLPADGAGPDDPHRSGRRPPSDPRGPQACPPGRRWLRDRGRRRRPRGGTRSRRTLRPDVLLLDLTFPEGDACRSCEPTRSAPGAADDRADDAWRSGDRQTGAGSRSRRLPGQGCEVDGSRGGHPGGGTRRSIPAQQRDGTVVDDSIRWSETGTISRANARS